MSFLSQMLATYDPATAGSRYDNYLNFGPRTASGVSVTPEMALKISTVWACVRLIAETVGSLPLIVYRRLPDGGRERATNHPLYDLLHDQPNRYQTAFEFRRMLTGHMLLRGNAYGRLIGGPRGFVDQIIPIHPDRVRVEQLTTTTPEPRYRYRIDNGPPLNDADILHLRGLESDGITGLDPISYAREGFGLSLAGERYGSRFFRNDARPTVVLKHPSKFKDSKTADRVRAHWNHIHGGEGQHGTAVLEEGMDLAVIGVDPRNAQFLESREFQAEDVCRWFGVPPHMVGLTSKTTTWGSGIEEMTRGFIKFALRSWLVNWEQAIARDLILAPDTYFVEHLLDGLERGDLKTRYESYAIARDKGWYSVNDIRRKENENPIEGGDVYSTEAERRTGTDRREPAAPALGALAELIEMAPSAHHIALAREAAGRVLRKEAAALGRLAKRAGGEEWRASVLDFFNTHADFVGQTLQLSQSAALAYVERQQRAALIVTGFDDWEARHLDALTTLVLEAA